MSSMPDRGPSQSKLTACFSVHAPTDSSVMPRVLEVFTRRGLIPSVWHSVLCGGQNEEIQIDVQVTDVDEPLAERLAQCLRVLPCVGCVLTSEKRQTIAA